MNEPITREEDTELLAQFLSAYRQVLLQHRANRLDLFFRLHFVGDGSYKAKPSDSLDPTAALAACAPASISQHALFNTVRRHFVKLARVADAALECAAAGALEPAVFRGLAGAMRRLDSVLDRFDVAITASLTDVDELTGLLNRAAMERDLERELAHARRNGLPLCVAMVDADHFKEVNDTHGHGFGDVVLEELAARFEAALRPRDRVYRYGGEEFLVVLPETCLQDATQVIERLRQVVCETSIADENVAVIQHVSAGVAQASSEDENEALIKRADAALYEAKTAGRNRVTAARS